MLKEKEQLMPAELWVGPSNMLVSRLIAYLQRILCPRGGCINCTTCKQIALKQHQSLLWIIPEKGYTLDLLDDLFHTITLKLEPNEHFFFILAHAEYLGASCSNKLLKSVEEPPTGYHFIFLSSTLESILPTIVSRCTVTNVYGNPETFHSHPLWALCTLPPTHPTRPSIQEAIRIIDKESPDERVSVALADALLSHWNILYIKAHQEGDSELIKRSQRALNIIEKALQMPPMPGGSKIFWRTILLNLD